MGILIAILNNISNWLVKKISKEIILDLWWNLDQSCFECDVVYRHHTTEELSVDIITEKETSLDEDVKIMGIVGDINDKYPMISIDALIFTQEEWDRVVGN